MRALVYGDVSPNVIDGSSIWLGSIVGVLAEAIDEVDVLLKYEPTNHLVTSAFSELPNVTVHLPDPGIDGRRTDGGLSPEGAVRQYESLAGRNPYDLLLVRGLEACLAFKESRNAKSVLWSYVTDLPFPPEKVSKVELSRLKRIAEGSFRMLSQTEASRSYLEAIAPAAAGKTLLLPPMIPAQSFAKSEKWSEADGVLRIVYAGKFARDWRTLELLELPARMGQYGVNAQLHVIGSKVQASTNDRTWPQRMRARLESVAEDRSSGVIWHGGVTRAESMSIIAKCDVGIGWRSEELDSSLEVSTKALEYGAIGTAPVINRTMDAEAQYGKDYPLFVTPDVDVEGLAQLIIDCEDLSTPSTIAQKASSHYSTDVAVSRWRRYVSSIPQGSTEVTERPIRVLIAAHDLKFLGEFVDYFSRDPRFVISTDVWTTLHKHDEEQSKRLLAEADVVFCEWAGPNLVWYSNHIDDRTALVTRLHGFELRNGQWFGDVDFNKVDALICVSRMYRDWAIRDLGLAQGQAVVIPNMIDVADLARNKLQDAQFSLGVAGYVPFLKRPDKALDLLSSLLGHDERYTLDFKGRPPWEYPHHWKSAMEKAAYLDFYARIREDELLRAAVRFTPFSPDIASWFRGIGFVLSPSDHESFHLAPAEGMASGAVPLIWERQGAAQVFGSGNVYEDMDALVNRVLSLQDPEAYQAESRRLRDIAQEKWDVKHVGGMWDRLFQEALSARRRS